MKERNQSTSTNMWRDIVTNPNWSPLDTALHYALDHLTGISEMETSLVFSRDGKRVRLHMYSEDNSWNPKIVPKIVSEWMSKTALLKHIQREINWFRKTVKEREK